MKLYCLQCSFVSRSAATPTAAHKAILNNIQARVEIARSEHGMVIDSQRKDLVKQLEAKRVGCRASEADLAATLRSWIWSKTCLLILAPTHRLISSFAD